MGIGGFGGSGVLGLVALVQFGPPLGFSTPTAWAQGVPAGGF